MNSMLQNGKMRVENQTKTRVWEDSSIYTETLTKITIREFYLSIDSLEAQNVLFVLLIC